MSTIILNDRLIQKESETLEGDDEYKDSVRNSEWSLDADAAVEEEHAQFDKGIREFLQENTTVVIPLICDEYWMNESFLNFVRGEFRAGSIRKYLGLMYGTPINSRLAISSTLSDGSS